MPVENTNLEDEYVEPLDEQAGDVFTILSIGDSVTTENGPGVVTNIELHGADYGDGRKELEPPSITVKLDESEEEIIVCPCTLELNDAPSLTQLLHDEYDRLWPPVEELPGEAETLIDDEKIENSRKSYKKTYLFADKYATHVVTAQGALSPGMVLEDLEGVDVGEEGVVVVEVSSEDGDKQSVTLYFPGLDETKTLSIPKDTTYRALDAPDPTKNVDTVYDMESLEESGGGGEGYIRWVPDSWIPKNPNGPSSLSDALWRPTYRQYPPWRSYAKVRKGNKTMAKKRFVRRKKGDYGYSYGPDEEDNKKFEPFMSTPEWIEDSPVITEQDIVEEDWDPDLQPSPDRLYENPIALFDPEKSPKETYDLASLLWQEYQTYRHKKVPGVAQSHSSFPFEEYCYIFMDNHDLSFKEMAEIWDYMEEIGFITKRERLQWNNSVTDDIYQYRYFRKTKL